MSELAWFQTHLGADAKVTGVFIVVRGDDVYQEITELSIRVGYRPEKLGIKDPPCGGTTHRFQRGSGRMIRCLPVEPGWYVTIFSPEVNSTLSLCEVEVETAKLGTVFLRYLVLFTSQVAYTLNQWWRPNETTVLEPQTDRMCVHSSHKSNIFMCYMKHERGLFIWCQSKIQA